MDHVLYAYHGLPEHQVAQTGTKWNLNQRLCKFEDHSPKCVIEPRFTTSKLAQRKNRFDGTLSHCGFQSGLVAEPWIKPYVEDTLEDIVKKKVTKRNCELLAQHLQPIDLGL